MDFCDTVNILVLSYNFQACNLVYVSYCCFYCSGCVHVVWRLMATLLLINVCMCVYADYTTTIIVSSVAGAVTLIAVIFFFLFIRYYSQLTSVTLPRNIQHVVDRPTEKL